MTNAFNEQRQLERRPFRREDLEVVHRQGHGGLRLRVQYRKASTARWTNHALTGAATTGVTTDSTGRLQGVSVNSAPGRSIEDLTANIPHNQVGVSTVGEIRQVGGQVVPSPTARNPYHATLSDLTPEDAERLFSPPIRNPNRR